MANPFIYVLARLGCVYILFKCGQTYRLERLARGDFWLLLSYLAPHVAHITHTAGTY